MKEQKVGNLDNSAKIFPIVSTKKYSTVFRISAYLKEDVKPEALQKATENALKFFESFRVKLKAGFFWYYYVKNEKLPIVTEDSTYPCRYIDPKENNGYLFKITYKKNKINIDIFHALTDGNSGMHFLKEIVYQYLDICYPNEIKGFSRAERKVNYTVEDSYLKNYNKKLTSNLSNAKAYVLQGEKLQYPQIGVISCMIPLGKLKSKAKENGLTITQYLTSILIYSIYQANYIKYNGKKPIKICIPVDLKKYFRSETIRNFFSYITVIAYMKKDGKVTLDEIIEIVRKDFKEKLTPEELARTMSYNVKIGNNPFVGIIPLFLKKIIVKIGYIEIRKYTTTTFSNVGRIGTIGAYSPFIEKFSVLIAPEPVEKIKCSSCSYDDILVFNFTSILEETNIEKIFYETLKSQNIDVKVEDNGVHKIIYN